MDRIATRLVFLIALAALMALASCSGSGTRDAGIDSGTDSGIDAADGFVDDAGDDVADSQGDDGGVDAGDNGDLSGDSDFDAGGDPGLTNECPSDENFCTDEITRRFCADTPQGRRWREEICADGKGCLQGECVAGACADACNLGESQGGKSCELFDLNGAAWVTPDPVGSMHDRARAYEMWLRRDGLYFGGVSNAIYSDPPDYTNVVYHGGMGDSSIWTGTYLAAEALRLMATGSADARRQTIELVNTLHLWFNVSGDPGVLARWVAPAGQSSNTELDCSDPDHHCGIDYEGNAYDYLGDISRDQYQGVMLGYAWAYQALGEQDEQTRALIRDDIVELVQELMRERTVPLQITWNGTDWPVRQVNVRFVVLCTREMTAEGAIHFDLDTSDFTNSKISGFQEFMPNWGDMISQVPGFGAFANIPRAGSAVMLASFFRVAMEVTDGIPGYEAEYSAFRDYYYNNPPATGDNVGYWIDVAKTWSYNDNCGGSYYANNIAMEPMFNLARLEDDAPTRLRILDEVLGAKMWPEHEHTKNCFFFYIYTAADPVAYAGAATIAGQQLAGFPPPPRVRVPVDLRADSRYLPHQSGCDNQTTRDKSADVAERVVSDFIWQRNPWQLFDEGTPQLTYPGVDYLVAYWLGRYLGQLQDDTPGRCLAWH
ncbi:MAG TPA: hypothetical protein VM425_01645 [Myxococcota bacterium]|nr:hypothetical protein [Myxococcota bacterium]